MEQTHSRLHTALNKRRVPTGRRSSDQPEEQTHKNRLPLPTKKQYTTTPKPKPQLACAPDYIHLQYEPTPKIVSHTPPQQSPSTLQGESRWRQPCCSVCGVCGAGDTDADGDGDGVPAFSASAGSAGLGAHSGSYGEQ